MVSEAWVQELDSARAPEWEQVWVPESGLASVSGRVQVREPDSASDLAARSALELALTELSARGPSESGCFRRTRAQSARMQ